MKTANPRDRLIPSLLMAHRIEVTGRVDYPDGSARVMFACQAAGCCTGHVEGDPAVVADVIVARLVESHRESDDMIPGLGVETPA